MEPECFFCHIHKLPLSVFILSHLNPVQSLSHSSLRSLLHFHVTSSLLGPNTFLGTLIPITSILCFSVNVRDKVLQAGHDYIN